MIILNRKQLFLSETISMCVKEYQLQLQLQFVFIDYYLRFPLYKVIFSKLFKYLDFSNNQYIIYVLLINVKVFEYTNELKNDSVINLQFGPLLVLLPLPLESLYICLLYTSRCV